MTVKTAILFSPFVLATVNVTSSVIFQIKTITNTTFVWLSGKNKYDPRFRGLLMYVLKHFGPLNLW